jgi:hypothetical protein
VLDALLSWKEADFLVARVHPDEQRDPRP